MNECELKRAVKRAEERYRKPAHLALAHNVIEVVAQLYNEGTPFKEALRYALNMTHIREKSERTLYASIVGFYFGPHRATRVRTRAQPTRNVRIAIERSGQYRWMF